MSNELILSNRDVFVCLYCKNLMITDKTYKSDTIFGDNNFRIYGCKLHQEEEQENFDRLYNGCEQFKISGLPAHPQIRKELLKKNSLTKKIPLSKEPMKCWYLFNQDIEEHISEENVRRLEIAV